MSPMVAMWCAMFSQKSFLRTSQNISVGTACSKASITIKNIAHGCSTCTRPFVACHPILPKAPSLLNMLLGGVFAHVYTGTSNSDVLDIIVAPGKGRTSQQCL